MCESKRKALQLNFWKGMRREKGSNINMSLEIQFNRRKFLKTLALLGVSPAMQQVGLEYSNKYLQPPFQMQIITPEVVSSIECPIVMFHGESVGLVQRIVDSYLRQGRQLITISELWSMMNGEVDLPAGGVAAMSFDDGLAIQKLGAKILKDRGAKATYAIIPGFRDGVHEYLPDEDIYQMSEDGNEFISHTLHHVNLAYYQSIGDGTYPDELIKSKEAVERLTQKPSFGICYPYGATSSRVIDDASQYYAWGLGTVPGIIQGLGNSMSFRRIKPNQIYGN